MTGGIGFSEQGKNSLKNNRKLLKGRPLRKDSPYVPARSRKGAPQAAHAAELQEWRDKKQQSEKR